MKDPALGRALRAYVLQELQHGRRPEPSRLQALLNDLVHSDQEPLLPALRTLVLSTAFGSAIRQDPPLADHRLLPRLQQELATTCSQGVRLRMDAVLGGLLDQPEPATGPAAETPAPIPPARPGRRLGWPAALLALTGVLALAAGVAMAVLGGGVALWLRHRSTQPRAEAPAPITPPLPPSTPAAPTVGTPDPGAGNGAQAAALQSLNSLYRALSAKDAVTASQYYSPESGDQFDPAFFGQFAGVTLSDLRETGRQGPVLSFSGVVTFAYADGTSQIESRTFTIDTSRSPAMVTASAFGRILQLRR